MLVADDDSVKRVLLRKAAEGYSLYRTRYLVAAEFRIETGVVVYYEITSQTVCRNNVMCMCMRACLRASLMGSANLHLSPILQISPL